jgi:pimeloyl-ACP methyl ester carboxylesterase
MPSTTENDPVRSNARLHPLRRWALILGSGGISLAVLLAAAGFIYQWAATRLDLKRYPAPGILVEVDGHRLHLDCRGTGQPTVIMDAGLGDSSVTWALVQPEVATFTRVCSYDRPGYGWSDEANDSDAPRDSASVGRQLHQLLDHAGISGPYLLVGHSFGGMNQLVFRSLYPQQVVGIVLVDSSHPDQFNRLPPAFSPEAYEASVRYRPAGAALGLARLLGWCRDDYTFPNVGEAWRKVAPEAIALDCRTSAFRASRAEEFAFRQSGRETAAAGQLGALPLIVLSHDPQVGIGFPPADAAQLERAWDQMQEELRGLSTNSRRIIARGSRHYVEAYRPELVITAIREVDDAARNGASLAAPTTTQ